jgi:hypothetical protein
MAMLQCGNGVKVAAAKDISRAASLEYPGAAREVKVPESGAKYVDSIANYL